MKCIHSLPEDHPIFGMTILNDELYVYYQMKNRTVSVYNKDRFDLQRTFSVPGLGGVSDMTSCRRYRCIYISDHVNNAIHRVADTYHISKYPVSDTPHGLSVNSSFNVLVTCDKAAKIKVFTTYGKLLRDISLQSDIVNPWCSAEVGDEQFVVCHGQKVDKLHRICIVNNYGKVLRSYGGVKGSGDGELSGPYAQIVNGFILVCDTNNRRVLMLSPSLQLYSQFLVGPRWPLRICFDESTCRLYVAECNWDKKIGRASCRERV